MSFILFRSEIVNFDAKPRTFLGLNAGALSIDATEGSAIKTALNVLAGDAISFDYAQPNLRLTHIIQT
ncbi:MULTISPECIES: hypothetical protein [unclassified Nostoc]|uniref:hypothetical protein n=1 Tax=unclassified Nostoc TaxID=2593658 RepID=UPI0013D3DACB|nr:MULTISPECIES: hypothetical protein [unclassified Nostoc]MBE9000544.1 hypothetical protein [Nostoc sp. LEGE 12447]NEU82647.1 hypothetical protein [Nostoc sp. UIC 10630]